MATKKVLMITYDYYPSAGGGIRYQKDVVDYFRSKNYIVDVLTISIDGQMHIESCAHGAVVRLPKLAKIHSATLSRPYCYIFGKMIKDYDIAHFNFPNPLGELAALLNKKKLKGVKTIAFYHADIVPAKRFSWIYNKLITPRFLKAMDHILVSSPNLPKYSPHLQAFKEKITVIPFGVDVDYYVPPLPDQKLSQSNSRKKTNVLFVGRLSRYKGIDYLIRAIGGLQTKLSIVGDGPLKESLIQLADSLNMKDQVEFCGHVSEQELLKKYQQADILVLPSTDAGEAFGYVLIEAMACRTALISTELKTGTSWVNADGETGFVVPPKDVDKLHNALKSLCDDPEMLERFKDQALRRAKELFSLERMLSETEELYCNTLSATSNVT
jgi:glycosyltransferase involved in cell wall biosynthesis